MKWLKLRRTFGEGWRNFFRDGWLSFATVSVLVLSLYIMSVTVVFGIVVRTLVGEAERSMNVSVYFDTETPEETMKQIQSELSGAQGILSVEYVSPDQALAQLRATAHGSDNIDKSLDVLGENPLHPSLVIRADDPREYDRIVRDVSGARFASLIYEINYERNREIIDNLTAFIGRVEKIGLSLGAVFVFIAILITYNAIRLSMYSNREEFEIMRLVGASNLYIKLPLLFEGMWYGVFAAVTTFALIVLTGQFVAPILGDEVSRVSFDFFLAYAGWVVGALLLSGILLGVFGSWIAVRRYLKI